MKISTFPFDSKTINPFSQCAHIPFEHSFEMQGRRPHPKIFPYESANVVTEITENDPKDLQRMAIL